MFCPNSNCSLVSDHKEIIINHLRRNHSYIDGELIECGELNCCRKFFSIDGYRKHLNRMHVNESNEEPTADACSYMNVVANDISCEADNIEMDIDYTEETNNRMEKKHW